MTDQTHLSGSLDSDPIVTVALQIPASKEAVLRRCADLLASGSPQGRAIENIIQVVSAAAITQSGRVGRRPDELGSAV